MLPGIKQFDLTGKTAIVTGGSKGLGQAMAEGLASAGANLLLTSRKADEVQAAAEQIARDYGVRAIGLAADVSSEDSVRAMVDRALAEFGQIDVLVNNAGINIRGPIEELTLDQFRQVNSINTDGLWLCMRAVVPHMKSRRYGKIVNIASTIGLVGLALRSPYAASKGAVVQMTKRFGKNATTHAAIGAGGFDCCHATSRVRISALK